MQKILNASRKDCLGQRGQRRDGGGFKYTDIAASMNMHRREIIRRVGQDQGQMEKEMVDREVPKVCVQYIGDILFLNTFFYFIIKL